MRLVGGIEKVFEAIAEYDDVGWFMDKFSNAKWVSNSGTFNPMTGELKLYAGNLSYFVSTKQIDPKHRGLTVIAKKIVKAYKEKHANEQS